MKRWAVIYFCVMLVIFGLIGLGNYAKNKEITRLKEQVVAVDIKGVTELENLRNWFKGQQWEYEARIKLLTESPETLRRIERLKGFKSILFSISWDRGWNDSIILRWDCVVTVLVNKEDVKFMGSSNSIELALNNAMKNIEEYHKAICAALEEK